MRFSLRERTEYTPPCGVQRRDEENLHEKREDVDQCQGGGDAGECMSQIGAECGTRGEEKVSNDQVIGEVNRKDESTDALEHTEVCIFLLHSISDIRSLYSILSEFILKKRDASNLSEE